VGGDFIKSIPTFLFKRKEKTIPLFYKEGVGGDFDFSFLLPFGEKIKMRGISEKKIHREM